MKIGRKDGRCNIAGLVIRTERERQQLSQEELAARLQLAGLNITQKAISRIETGSRVVPDYELEYLADSLHLTVSQLLGVQEQDEHFDDQSYLQD